MIARSWLLLTLPMYFLAACTATGGSSQKMAGLSADAQKIVEEAGGTDPNGEKASLDASIQKYRTVKLKDEETGKVRIICKRVRQPGTLFETKVCTTKEEWDAARQEAKDKTDGIQRNMDSRCPVCG